MWGDAGAQGRTFFEWTASDKEIVKSVLLLTGSIEGTKMQVMEYVGTFGKFAFLYETELKSVYAAFMATRPTLEGFENELKKYMAVEEEIQRVPPVHNIGAMSIETKPLKQSLMAAAKEWKTQFAKNLHGKGKQQLQDIHDYMRETMKLNREVEDLEDVRTVMGVLKEIRDREAEIDAIMTPIEEIYALLERYKVEVPKEETQTVSELRAGWGKMKKVAVQVGDDLSRLQVGFKRELISEVKVFVVDAQEFRDDFERNGPTVPGLDPPEAVDRLTKYTQMFDAPAEVEKLLQRRGALRLARDAVPRVGKDGVGDRRSHEAVRPVQRGLIHHLGVRGRAVGGHRPAARGDEGAGWRLLGSVHEAAPVAQGVARIRRVQGNHR